MTIQQTRIRDAQRIGKRHGHLIMTMGAVGESEITLVCTKCRTKSAFSQNSDMPNYLFSACLTKPQVLESKPNEPNIIQFPAA